MSERVVAGEADFGNVVANEPRLACGGGSAADFLEGGDLESGRGAGAMGDIGPVLVLAVFADGLIEVVVARAVRCVGGGGRKGAGR